MVDSIRPTTGTLSTNNPYSAQGAVQGVQSHGDDTPLKSKNWKRIERRTGRDRRYQEEPDKHPKFEMRCTNGRRKEDRLHPAIETKA